jgi:putative ATP-dependent DNA ligase
MGITRQQVLDAIKKGRAERLKEDIEYVRFRERHGRILRGTVVTRNRVIAGYEHIPRIFTLGSGIGRNIKADEVCIEEKIDGFNLRVAKVEGAIFAFSRGGYIDAFSTEKARGLGLEGFFADYPERVLCGEMVGNTPYTEPTERFDVRLFVFDIDEGGGTYLPCEERYATLKKYGIEGVPRLGKYAASDIKKIRELALSLNKAKKEGMVIKTPDRKAAVKFVTPNADIEDIGKCSHTMFDMPLGFYVQRVFRSGIFVKEFGLDRKEYARRLGEAFYSGLIRGFEMVGDGRGSEEEFEILIRDPRTWDTIHRHMSKEVKLEVISNRDERGGRRIRFRKIYKKTTKKMHDALSGKSVTD